MVSGNRLVAILTPVATVAHHVTRAIRHDRSVNPCDGGRFCLCLMSPVNCGILSPEIQLILKPVIWDLGQMLLVFGLVIGVGGLFMSP